MVFLHFFCMKLANFDKILQKFCKFFDLFCMNFASLCKCVWKNFASFLQNFKNFSTGGCNLSLSVGTLTQNLTQSQCRKYSGQSSQAVWLSCFVAANEPDCFCIQTNTSSLFSIYSACLKICHSEDFYGDVRIWAKTIEFSIWKQPEQGIGGTSLRR